MKKIIYGTLFTILLSSCTTNNPAVVVAPTTTITPTLIIQGNLYGAGQENIQEQRTVIDNQADFDALQIQMSIVNNTQFPPTIPVNFNTHKVIAVFDQIRGNGGNSIDIINAVENQNNVVITVQRLLTGGLTSVITQPYHIVKIPLINKPIIFN